MEKDERIWMRRGRKKGRLTTRFSVDRSILLASAWLCEHRGKKGRGPEQGKQAKNVFCLGRLGFETTASRLLGRCLERYKSRSKIPEPSLAWR